MSDGCCLLLFANVGCRCSLFVAGCNLAVLVTRGVLLVVDVCCVLQVVDCCCCSKTVRCVVCVFVCCCLRLIFCILTPDAVRGGSVGAWAQKLRNKSETKEKQTKTKQHASQAKEGISSGGSATKRETKQKG